MLNALLVLLSSLFSAAGIAMGLAFVVAVVWGALWWLPFGRWSFEYAGRRFEVSNHLVREVIRVDGEVVRDTRLGTDWLTWSTHAIALPGGQQLDIHIVSSNGMTMECLARVGDAVVFDSRVLRASPGAARAVLPPAASAPVAAAAAVDVTDPRWPAAKVLLDELRAEPEHADAAATLSGVLTEAFQALTRARRSADAHRALGASGDADAVVADREASVREGLDVLQQLHLAVTTRAPRSSGLEASLGRMAALREVEAASRRRNPER